MYPLCWERILSRVKLKSTGGVCILVLIDVFCERYFLWNVHNSLGLEEYGSVVKFCVATEDACDFDVAIVLAGDEAQEAGFCQHDVAHMCFSAVAFWAGKGFLDNMFWVCHFPPPDENTY